MPLILFGVLSYQWFQKQTDSSRTIEQFIQRQNSVIAADAVTVSVRVSQLLNSASHAARALPHIKRDRRSWVAFLEAHQEPLRAWDREGHRIITSQIPLFSELSGWNLKSEELLRVGSPVAARLRNRHSCDVRSRCDPKLILELAAAPAQTLRLGRLVRWYSPEGTEDDTEGAGLVVGFRTADRIYLVTLDYRHLKSVLMESTFPYEKRGDLLEGYQNGNYVYITDHDHNIIAHPKYWHVYGFDRSSGEPVPPMMTDSDNGVRPLNIARYRSGKLREYFDRLLNRSFNSDSVDIFSAVNLTGTDRVLAVAPIRFSDGQFSVTGKFGHVIIGCNVEFYSDPKEQRVPYY